MPDILHRFKGQVLGRRGRDRLLEALGIHGRAKQLTGRISFNGREGLREDEVLDGHPRVGGESLDPAMLVRVDLNRQSAHAR